MNAVVRDVTFLEETQEIEPVVRLVRNAETDHLEATQEMPNVPQTSYQQLRYLSLSTKDPLVRTLVREVLAARNVITPEHTDATAWQREWFAALQATNDVMDGYQHGMC